MSFSFSSLVRLIVLMLVGTTMLAVGVSRLDPRKPVGRSRRPVTHLNISEYFLDSPDRTPRWLDLCSGQIGAQPLSDGDLLEAATCSPWVDDKGDRQVIGRWTSRTTDGPMSMSRDFGLARYSFPSGEMLDQVSTDTVPVGPPCWYPGTRARVLFAAGDGMLYHFAFEPESGLAEGSVHETRPLPITWRCPMPGLGKVFMADLSWPEDPRMRDVVLVAMRTQALDSRGTRSFTRTQLWWLKLNHAGTEIIEVGRLLTPENPSPTADHVDERTPTVGTLPDGSLMLAYLRQKVGQVGWDLRIAPISFPAESHAPVCLTTGSRLVRDRCQPHHPAFSPDGRWLSFMSGAKPAERRLSRVAIVGDLPARSTGL